MAISRSGSPRLAFRSSNQWSSETSRAATKGTLSRVSRTTRLPGKPRDESMAENWATASSPRRWAKTRHDAPGGSHEGLAAPAGAERGNDGAVHHSWGWSRELAPCVSFRAARQPGPIDTTLLRRCFEKASEEPPGGLSRSQTPPFAATARRVNSYAPFPNL